MCESECECVRTGLLSVFVSAGSASQFSGFLSGSAATTGSWWSQDIHLRSFNGLDVNSTDGFFCSTGAKRLPEINIKTITAVTIIETVKLSL